MTRTVGAGLLALVGLMVACEQPTPSRPTPLPPVTAPSVAAITPTTGSAEIPVLVTIRGSGFLAGATVTLDAVATDVTVIDGTTITAMTPVHGPGTVDVVVTNPAGHSGRLTGGFTYISHRYTITSSTSTVVTGGQLSVSWTVPVGGAFDWVGLFHVGEPSTNYESGWWQYTDGAPSGTVTLQAPTTPGQYEFRYLLNDGYVDAVRSSPVTVTPG